MLLRRLTWLIPVASATFATPSLAQEGADHSACFEGRQYDACFREGKARFAADEYDEAYEAYLEGWRLKRNYEVAGNLGNVELKLGRHGAAYTHLKYSLDNLPPSQRGSDVEAKLKEKLQEALQHVGGRRFDTDPDASEITIDGETLDDPNLWVGVEPGERKLVVAKPGFTTVERTLDVRAGTEESTSIVLVPSSSEAPAPAPIGGPGPDAADEGPELIVPLVIVGGVVGLGAIGAGIGLHVVAGSKADERQTISSQITDVNACSGTPTGETAAQCQAVSDLADEENTFSAAGTGLLIGGAVVTVATAVYAIVVLTSGDDSSPADSAITLMPTFAPTETGLTVIGRF